MAEQEPRVGGVEMPKLAEDFGDTGGGNGGSPELSPAIDQFLGATSVLGDPPDGWRFTRPDVPAKPGPKALKADWVAYGNAMEKLVGWTDEAREKMGIAWQFVRQGLDLLPKVDPGPGPDPTPGPARVRLFAVTYEGHQPAKDGYPGFTDDQKEWGPHHGVNIVIPRAGNVSMLTLPTPLHVWKTTREANPDWWAAVERFFEDWTCLAPWVVRPHEIVVTGEVDPAQTMYVAVYDPDGGIQVDRQVLVRRLVLGHVHQSIRTGRQAAGVTITVVWNTGINFEAAGNPTARASHVHLAPSVSGQLLPNGDVDGTYGALALGWDVEDRGVGPGPTDYQRPNVWCAGRRLADFQAAGRPVPPPAG